MNYRMILVFLILYENGLLFRSNTSDLLFLQCIIKYAYVTLFYRVL